MSKDDKYKCSGKELRFVTSAEQMLPFLDRIRGQSNDSDDPKDSDTNDNGELNENDVVQASDNNHLTVPIVVPKISASNTSEALALPNIYEEYVNFIDLSVLNPIINAKHCQRDRLIESEISEPNCLWFLCSISIAIKREIFSFAQTKATCELMQGARKGLVQVAINVNEMKWNEVKWMSRNQPDWINLSFYFRRLCAVSHSISYHIILYYYDCVLAQLASVQ